MALSDEKEIVSHAPVYCREPTDNFEMTKRKATAAAAAPASKKKKSEAPAAAPEEKIVAIGEGLEAVVTLGGEAFNRYIYFLYIL